MCKIMEDMRNQSLQEGIQEGIKQGIKQGVEQGVKQGIASTVLRMLASGKYALEEIAEISGLTLDEVKALRTEQGA